MSETDTGDIQTQEFEEHDGAMPDPSRLPEPQLVTFIEGSLERLSIESLGRISEAVQQLRQTKQDEARQSTRQSIEEQLQRSGLSLRDLFPELLPGRKGGEPGSIPPKYRGPNGEVWSGRGHTPRWLEALVAEGRTKAEFLIAKDVE